MVSRIVLLSGSVASGKSSLATRLAGQWNLLTINTGDLLKSSIARLGGSGRVALQHEGDRLDAETGGTWVVKELISRLRDSTVPSLVIVDSVRIPEQIDAIRDVYGSTVTHIHLTAALDTLAIRYANRQTADDLTYVEIRKNQTESEIEKLADLADVVIDTSRSTIDDVLVRAASYLRLFGADRRGYVDVIVGGQYGSEGKGNIASFLANDYDLLVRVGGPNAGHKVFEVPKPYTHHQLPSGTRNAPATKLLIGPGAVLDAAKLLTEIDECGIEDGRLQIDGNATIIVDDDLDAERDLVSRIGSTGQGVGSAAARRIMKRGSGTKLARDVPELEPFICSAFEVLEGVFSQNGRVCLEGTQGTELSLFHGNYPYVTSRDTTAAGCIAEAGIPPGKVRRVIMVCRTYPIRVESPAGGSSGPMSQEISFEAISERSGIPLEVLESTERTSTTARKRRVGEFDWSLLRKASLLNQPTDVALTFADYLNQKNQAAKRFEQLDPYTINFVQEVERVSKARVSLISTGFGPRNIIDRRTW